MKKIIFIIGILFTINIHADILDEAIDFWYVNKDYKKTETYTYWSDKINNANKNYKGYKRENPYRAVAIESLLETGAIAVSIVGIFEIGAANSISYVIKNYNNITTTHKNIIYPVSKPKPRITNYEKNIINSGINIKYQHTRVIQRDSLFEHSTKNLSRMKNGQPPIGSDKEPIQLHHLKQENKGTLIEVLAKDEHKKEYKILHRYKTESEIDRSKFNAFRSSYWKERGKRSEDQTR